MRVLLFHGYLLRGTGSNVYNAELAQALARQGHEVHLFCQDRQASDLAWVDAVGDWESGSLQISRTGEGAAAHAARQSGSEGGSQGSITTYRPDIAGLLPVYVYDRYAGFEVKTFPELTDFELARYIEKNVAAIREVAERIGGFDAALANHLVMSPAILARAGLRFAVKVHGSDLSYTVRPHPKRFVPYAEEGVEAASAVLVGSLHTARDLWETVESRGLREKTRLGPPGLDPDEFKPYEEPGAASAGLQRLAKRLRSEADGSAGASDASGSSIFGRDEGRAADAISWFADAPKERVIFVGKLLVNKGIDLLLAAWPLVVAEHPEARLLLSGFGAFAETAERLWMSIEKGDIEAARTIAESADEDGAVRRLRLLAEFLADPPAEYRQMGTAAAGSVRISGRLEHSEVAEVVPAAEVLVMPSTFPEAFGMVAAEAAASGSLPVSAGHSGMAEVSARLAEALEPELAWLLSFDLDADPVRAIAARVNAWLALDPERREGNRVRLRRRAVELWSWEGVARSVISASNGDISALPKPGTSTQDAAQKPL